MSDRLFFTEAASLHLKQQQYADLLEIPLPERTEITRETGAYAEAFDEEEEEYPFSSGQGSYTLEDLQFLPEDQYFELIEGYLIFKNMPTWNHQKTICELYFQIESHIQKNKGRCQVIQSPFAAHLNEDDLTLLIPDLMVICDEAKITNDCIEGAPDFIAEVLSRSTQRLDRIKKLNLYKNAGVREYWIVDTERQSVQVYLFDSFEIQKIKQYSFREKIPVHILEGLYLDMSDLQLLP